jgi:hypothetical protein
MTNTKKEELESVIKRLREKIPGINIEGVDS